MNIFTKLFIFVSVIGMTCILSIGITTHNLNRNFFRSNIVYDNELIVSRSGSEMELYLSQYRQDLELIAELISALKTDEWRQELLLRIIGKHIENFRDIALVDVHGKAQATALPRRNLLNLSKERIFQEALTGKRAYSEVLFDHLNAPTMFMAVPVKKLGQVEGVVWGQLDLKRVWDILEKIKPGPLSRAYVLDRKGKSMSQEGVVQLRALVVPEPAKQKQWVGDERVHSWDMNLEGDEYLVSGVEIPEIGWNLLLLRPHTEVYQFFFKSIMVSTIVMFLLAIVTFVVTWWYAKRFVRPIQTLRDGAVRLAGGDLVHRIAVPSRDELGQLCDAFNQMAEDLKRYLQRLVRKTEQDAHQRNLSVLGITAGKIAHQVGNFLNTMSFGLSNLKMNNSHDASNKNIEVMERNIRSFEDFIRGYLAFAKKPRLNVALSDLKRELELLVEEYPADDFSIDLQFKPGESGDFLLECDIAQLRQAFLCIIDNAREAQNETGNMEIIIEDLSEHLLLTFRDNGSGLQTDDAEHIFELFFTTKGREGTGLGLAIVKSTIDAHFGSIVAKSVPGGGTIFIIELPKNFGA